jgi:hypothetical protein
MSEALRAALSLLSAPAQVRAFRKLPLPDDTRLILLIASGDLQACLDASELTRRAPDHLVSAASFFIEQILLCPDSDSYRVLGLEHSAPASDLRAHMALLMRWVHPDVDRSGKRAPLAHRVLRAWDDVKTPERRARYDAEISEKLAATPNRRPSKGRSRESRTSLRHRIKTTLQRMLYGA